jgi:hypothetical protein
MLSFSDSEVSSDESFEYSPVVANGKGKEVAEPRGRRR